MKNGEKGNPILENLGVGHRVLRTLKQRLKQRKTKARGGEKGRTCIEKQTYIDLGGVDLSGSRGVSLRRNS